MNKNKWLKDEISFIQRKIKNNVMKHSGEFPSANTVNLKYTFGENVAWTPSFWTGMLFLNYEVSSSEYLKVEIKRNLSSFKNRLEKKIEMDNHDIGFYFSLSHVANYQLFRDVESRKIIISAAEMLYERFNEKSGIIQAWGDSENKDEQGRMIIDCNMNLCLLYRAYELTGEKKFYDCAFRHIKNAQKYLVRSDNSTFHTYYFDTLTGNPISGTTAQGYSDTSCWSRGQAWAVYGFTLNYIYTGDDSLLKTAVDTADYFIERLPDDLIPYWDLSLKTEDTQRDSSSGAILAAGLLELGRQLPVNSEKKIFYEELAVKIIKSLSEKYTTKTDDSNGILKHAVYSIPHNLGVDECCLWGDYFYFESIVRITQPWRPYW